MSDDWDPVVIAGMPSSIERHSDPRDAPLHAVRQFEN